MSGDLAFYPTHVLEIATGRQTLTTPVRYKGGYENGWMDRWKDGWMVQVKT